MQQNPLQLLLSLLAAREEVIFMLRVIGHQMHEDCRNKLGTLREIQDEIIRGEQKRENLEHYLFQNLNEGYRKLFLPKIIQKYTKITQYYLVKTQIYFPNQGQVICQEVINQPNLRNSISHILQESLVTILKFICNLQKQKLKHELAQMFNYEQEDRCNRNEKFYSEPLILGVIGLRYLNELHKKYCYSVCKHNNRNVYDVLFLDDNTKQLYLYGGGFSSLISSITKLKDKSVDNTQSVYIPVESTLEIITQRYEKLLKEIMDQNYHVQKSVNKYYDQYKKYKMKPLLIKGYVTPKKQGQDFKSQRIQKRSIESGPMLSDMGRYSEPISRNPLTQDSLNSVRSKQAKFRTQKQSDIILSGFISPKQQTIIRKHRSLKNYDPSLLKPTILQNFYDSNIRINHNTKKQN
ncbi:unnamed protein product [Paramecium primaurelia]|uniref:Uncharacterized protein n=1 Tax=Paramecium primaurelia TaxID=5886 RepID=A0A8S1JUN4_PARPR|nr:unnamed protein product [Paramecium primaurelia]